MCTPKRVMHTKNSVLSKALHLKSQSGAILRVVNICVGSCGGAAVDASGNKRSSYRGV